MLVVLVATWARFCSWIQTMCNRMSCAHVQELVWSHDGDNRECTLDLLITYIFTLVVLVAIWALFVYLESFLHFIMLVVLVGTLALFGSWIPTIYNRTSCAHKLGNKLQTWFIPSVSNYSALLCFSSVYCSLSDNKSAFLRICCNSHQEGLWCCWLFRQWINWM